jgi:hypothetical protein
MFEVKEMGVKYAGIEVSSRMMRKLGLQTQYNGISWL